MTTHRQFGQQGHPRIYLWTGDSKTPLSLGGDCISFQCSKSITSPVGTFSVSLLPRTGVEQLPADAKRLSTLYKSDLLNRVISIGYDTDGGIMLGLVGNVSDTFTMSAGQLVRALTLTGQDFGKALIRDNVISALITKSTPEQSSYVKAVEDAFGADSPLLQFIKAPVDVNDPTKSGYFEGKTVEDVAAWAVGNLVNMQIPVLKDALGGKGLTGDYFDAVNYVTSFASDVIYGRTVELSVYQGSAWGFIQSLIDLDFYECWVDTVPLWDTGLPFLNEGVIFPNVVLIMRPKPFEEPDYNQADTSSEPGLGWNDLRCLVTLEQQHDINLDEIIQGSFSIGEDDVYNHFQVQSNQIPSGQDSGVAEALAYPLTDIYSVKRFGLRQYNAKLNLVGGDMDAFTQATFGEVTQFRNRLFNWHRWNAWMEDASIRCAGRDEFRVGDPVRLPWREAPVGDELGMRYYTAHVVHSWGMGQPYVCQLQLTRGHNAGMLKALTERVRDGAPTSAPDNWMAV